jgi:hypothetical protein
MSEIEHTHDEHLTVIPKMTHNVVAGPGRRLTSWDEPAKPTRKEILERDAEEAIERERDMHVPRHMKRGSMGQVSIEDPIVANVQGMAAEAAERLLRAHFEERAALLEAQRVIEVRAAIDRYFDDMHTTTWGRGFDLITNREAAVDHLLNTFIGVSEALVTMRQEARAARV